MGSRPELSSVGPSAAGAHGSGEGGGI